MKKVLYLFILFLACIGLLGGFGYTLYIGEYVIGIGIVALGVLAFNNIKKLFKNLCS